MSSEDSEIVGIVARPKRRFHPTEPLYYVYVYYDENGIPRYVGKGKGPRLKQHYHPCRKSRLAQALSEGKKFSCEKLAVGLTEAQAFEAEKKYIAEFVREVDGGTLWNLTRGGDGVSGFVMPKEAIEKLSVARKGKKLSEDHRKKLSLAKIGRKRTPEEIAKFSASMRGRKRPRHLVERTAAANRGRKLGPQTPEHIAKAARFRKGRKVSAETCAKLSEKAQERPPDVYERIAAWHRTKIICTQTNEIFGGVNIAARALGLHPSAISLVLNGFRKTTGGLHFRFVEGDECPQTR